MYTFRSQPSSWSNGCLVVAGNASVNVTGNVIANASAIYAGVASVTGVTTITAKGNILGDNWTPVPQDANTWTPVSGDTNTWTVVSTGDPNAPSETWANYVTPYILFSANVFFAQTYIGAPTNNNIINDWNTWVLSTVSVGDAIYGQLSGGSKLNYGVVTAITDGGSSTSPANIYVTNPNNNPTIPYIYPTNFTFSNNAFDANTWTPVSANDNTWTIQAQGSNTWLRQN